jgi:hypothetical protein
MNYERIRIEITQAYEQVAEQCEVSRVNDCDVWP